MACKYYSKYAVQDYNKKEEAKSDDNPYWSNICSIADRQRKKGIETYGQGIEQNPMKIQERLTYLEEELVDSLMYIEWIKDFLSKQNVENID